MKRLKQADDILSRLEVAEKEKIGPLDPVVPLQALPQGRHVPHGGETSVEADRNDLKQIGWYLEHLDGVLSRLLGAADDAPGSTNPDPHERSHPQTHRPGEQI